VPVNALRFRRLCVGGKTLTAITTAIVILVTIAKRCWIASLTVLTFSGLAPSVHNEVQRAESTVARPERKKKVESLTIPELESLTIYLHQPEESFIRRRVPVILSVSNHNDDGFCDLESFELVPEDHR
jgi:hypothetical protein